MADWLQSLGDKLGSAFLRKRPALIQLLPQIIDPGDPRVTIRPMGNDWLCPFTCKRLLLAEWDGSSVTLLEQPTIIDHLLTLPLLQQKGLQAQMLPWDTLVDAAANIRLLESPSYKISSDKGYWICPHCLCVTEVLLTQWDGTLAPLNWFVPQALEHLHQCPAYSQDPLNPKSPEDMVKSQGEQGIRMELMKRVALDPVFRVTDDNGTWVCPFSHRLIPAIKVLGVGWSSGVEAQIVDYLLSAGCPGKYSQWRPDVSVVELQRIAGRLSAEKAFSSNKQASEDELKRLRTRVAELDVKVASADEIQKDLEAARKVQLKMLPAKPPELPGYEIAAYYQPCVQLGGDLYNFIDVAPGRTGLVIGDVSGHGVSAAVIMAMAQKSFALRAPNCLSAGEVMRSVNQDLIRDMPRGRFVTAFYGVLEQATGKVRCVRSGHTPSLVLHADGQLSSWEGDGLALGLGSQVIYSQKLEEYVAEIPPEALLLLYTDGIPEAMNAAKEEFTDQRLRETLGSCAGYTPQATITCLLSAVRAHAGNNPLEDDVTVVAIKRLSS